MSPRLRRLTLCLSIACASLAIDPVHASAADPPRVTMTRSWSAPSADPRGITYDKRSDHLVISDSEIDQTAKWRGKNLFITGRGGRLYGSRTLEKATHEPEDIAWDDHRQVLYVVSDDQDQVFRFRRGPDDVLGTADDRVHAVLHTRRFGSSNAQGLDFRVHKRMLILADAVLDRIYEVRPGSDGHFDTRDDVVTSFSTQSLSFDYPTGVAFDEKSNRLFIVGPHQNEIVETTMGGDLVETIDLSGTTIRSAQGITIAPGTNGGHHHLFLVDAGRDDSVVPDANDGRVFEFAIKG
jgi:hypothetical protein